MKINITSLPQFPLECALSDQCSDDVLQDHPPASFKTYPRYETEKMRSRRMFRDSIKNAILSRRRVLRAFEQWLAQHGDTFAVPVSISRRYTDHLELVIKGYTSALNITLGRDLIVAVEHNGECWDLLISLEALPQKTREGYICGLCLPEHLVNYPTPEAMWRNHLFEPFRDWVNDKLAPCHWIALYGSSEEGATWVTLWQTLPPSNDNLNTVLPLTVGF